jgi:hypothetical protein
MLQKILKCLFDAFPDKSIKPDTMKVYAEKLADVPVEALEKAVDDLINSATFLPRISEIRTAVAKIHEASGRYQQTESNDPICDTTKIMTMRKRLIQLQEIDAANGFQPDNWLKALEYCKANGYLTNADDIERRLAAMSEEVPV